MAFLKVVLVVHHMFLSVRERGFLALTLGIYPDQNSRKTKESPWLIEFGKVTNLELCMELHDAALLLYYGIV